MSSITHNPKYNLYQIKGAKNIYLFDFETCQQVKKDFEGYSVNIPPLRADEWYDSLGSFRRKKIKVVEK